MNAFEFDNNSKLFHGDCIEGIKNIPDNSIDVVLTDPPYLYLKHKLDKVFDEDALFNEYKRVLKDKGFVILFGRGTSFYRWNTILADLNFIFKEEIIWDKKQSTSPFTPIIRLHETISIYTKKNGIINKNNRVPYLEVKGESLKDMKADIKTLCAGLNNPKSLKLMLKYLDNVGKGKDIKSSDYKDRDYCGKHEITMKVDNSYTPDRCYSSLHAIVQGYKERSIVHVPREHYQMVHPTQKPNRLLERLLNLVIPTGSNNITVLDTFAGSGSTAIASYNLSYDFIGYEIDEGYFDIAKERITEHLKTNQKRLFA